MRRPDRPLREIGRVTRAAAEVHGASRPRTLARIGVLALRGGFGANDALSQGLLDPAMGVRQALHDHASKRSNARAQERLNPPELLDLTEDKEVFARAVAERGLPAARTIAVVGGPGGDRRADGGELGGAGGWAQLVAADPAAAIVAKPVDGFWGRGVRVFHREGDGFRENDRTWTAEALHASLTEDAGRRIVQERVVDHPVLQAINPTAALQTVRLTMLLDADGVHVIGASVKLAAREAVADNYEGGRTGSMMAIIDPVAGVISEVWVPRRGGVGGADRAEGHPVTGSPIVGWPLPCWDEVRALADRASRAFAPLRTIGWDIAITAEGPLLIEANARWDPLPHASSGAVLRRLRRA